MPTVLIVDDDAENALRLSEIFRRHGFSAETASDLLLARDVMLRKMPEVAVFDELVRGKSALDVLEELDVARTTEIYLITSSPSIQSATRAMRIGISDYMSKPVDPARLASNLDDLRSDADHSLGQRSAKKSGRGLLLGESIPMQRLYRLLRKCAPSEASILITGESGTGKDLVAQTIHDLSERSKRKLVAVNCSAIHAELMESELFGHQKGSFTGATAKHRGLFETASGGTLFLDEITEMNAGLQAKLLRVLEAGCVRPVGSEREIEVDVRIIAATNQDLGQAVENGKLREDLYYRLAQFPIHLPPLRERDDDVLLLAEHFLDQECERGGVAKTFSQDVVEAFRLHDWPGNIRELRNAVVRGYLLAGKVVSAEDLPEGIPATLPISGEFVRMSIGTPLAEVERRHILATLAHLDGNKKHAAETLGISLKTLYNRLKRYEAQ